VAPSPWHLGLDNAVTARSVDLAAQEDARQFTWAAPGALAIDGPPVDLTRQADEGFEVRLDWRIDALPAGPIKVSVGTGSLDVASLLRLAPQGPLPRHEFRCAVLPMPAPTSSRWAPRFASRRRRDLS
jgi:beta-glucosidase